MAEGSKIEWTDHTFNPWWGCTKVSAGCKNCYAETLATRYQKDCWGPKGPRRMMSESYWQQPVKWNKQAGERFERIGDSMFAARAMVEEQARRPRVFCASMADVFEGATTMPAESWLDVEKARARLFMLIGATPNLDWLLLTKRPENVKRYVPPHWDNGFPDNVWVGTSVEDQEQAEERIPHLAQIPAKVRFLSCEPLLGHVSIGYAGLNAAEYGSVWWPDWVIVGGESGPGKRPFDPEWGRRILADCKAAGVPFFGKQWDKVQQLPDDLMVREFPKP